MIELQDAFAQSRGQNPTTQETHIMRGLMVDAVVAANHSSYVDKKNQIPKRFLEILKEYKYNPSIRGEAQLKLLFSYLVEGHLMDARAQGE